MLILGRIKLLHTNTGGKAVDQPPKACYGWVCVNKLHDVDNADSLNQLAMCMYLFSKGLWVDSEGRVQKI